MMRILVVDDDAEQAQSLGRLIALSAKNLLVEVAVGGASALERLKLGRTDLVLTDLQMPGTSGIEVVEWVMAYQPHVTVFAMTAYPDDSALQRLEECGTVECFIKPLDVPRLTKRLEVALSDGLRGQLRNIALPSLMQLVDLERKTCTFVLRDGPKQGYLYFRDGNLIDARCGTSKADAAAIEMVSWSNPQVTILSTCAAREREVQNPAGFIIMEALRIADERSRRDVTGETAETVARRPSTVPPPVRARPVTLSQFPTPPPTKASAVAVISRETGAILTSAGQFDRFDRLAQVFSAIFSEQSKTARALGEEEGVEEMVLTGKEFWAVCRPLEFPAGTMAVSVFDPKEATVAMERYELNGLALALREWTRRSLTV